MKTSVKNVQITKTKVQTVRFRLILRKQLVRVTSFHQPPLFVERLGKKAFIAGPKKELPVSGKTPAEAMERSMHKFWH
jgi:hypothetical protein